MGWIILFLGVGALLFIAFMWFMSACACAGKEKKQAEEDAREILGCNDCRTVNSCHGCDFLAKVNDGLVTIDDDGGTFYKKDNVGGL